MIHVRGAELDTPCVSFPRAIALVHLEQALLHARVNAGGDDALDLHALARQRVLVVTVSVVRGDALGVPLGGGGQVTHGVFRSRAALDPFLDEPGGGWFFLLSKSLPAAINPVTLQPWLFSSSLNYINIVTNGDYKVQVNTKVGNLPACKGSSAVPEVKSSIETNQHQTYQQAQRASGARQGMAQQPFPWVWT